ncbi:hypothetical protein [Parachlamydia sp. AcF125]|uniref:hypothetical protein n=1 Tax=Parachlamydia sp. AcF125 TaxID=2795736 RepID=UPI001BC980B8|nr:hypothetical protein [Parachlamydia sp. AcF125]MBS4169160.1 hypothetical protein [Parachlamydia sp. AcF125]
MDFSLPPPDEVKKCLETQKYHQYYFLDNAVKQAYRGRSVYFHFPAEGQKGLVAKIWICFLRFLEKCKMQFKPGYKERFKEVISQVFTAYNAYFERAHPSTEVEDRGAVNSEEEAQLNEKLLQEEIEQAKWHLKILEDRFSLKKKLIAKKETSMASKQAAQSHDLVYKEKCLQEKEGLISVINEMDAYIAAPVQVGWFYCEKKYDKNQMRDAFHLLNLNYDSFNYDEIEEAKEKLKLRLAKVERKLEKNNSRDRKIKDLAVEIKMLKEDCDFLEMKIEKQNAKISGREPEKSLALLLSEK